MSAPPPEKRKKNTEYFEVYSGPDGFGRHRFAILWWAPDFHGGPSWRGQHFHAKLSDYTEKTIARGRKVVIVEVPDA